MRIRTFNEHTLYPGHTGNSGGTHPYSELLYITKGKAILEWMGERYAGPSPCLFLLTPNTPHRLICGDVPIHFWYIELNVEHHDTFATVEQAIRWNRLQAELDYGSVEMEGIRHALEGLVWSLQAKHRGEEYDELVVIFDVKKIVRLIHNRLRAAKQAAFDSGCRTAEEWIELLMRHMESNYVEPIDLTALSKKVHLNPSYLIRVFKNYAGITPMQYLSNLRLSAAASYLLHSEMTVQKIAEETGFSSIHYFSRLFKRKYGISPQQWRNEHRAARQKHSIP
jgi:AraC-like DNA-binding protein